MRPFSILILAFLFTNSLDAQQLYVEVFTGRSTANFNDTLYRNRSGFFPLGGRIAAGKDHFQLGAEISTNMRQPTFNVFDEEVDTIIGNHQFNHNYYGLFLRGKWSRYPARRFGLNGIVGIGYFDLDKTVTIKMEENKFSYGKTLSYSAEIGISVPTQGMGMVEIGYGYRFVNLKEQPFLPAIRGSFHMFRLGFSLNFVFGKKALEYQVIKKKI